MQIPIEKILATVQKPSRYLGIEWNRACKTRTGPWIRIGLAYPDMYEIGMSNMSVQILYAILNNEPDIFAERVFHPGPDLEETLRKSGCPLFSLESHRPIPDFHILGFTLQSELTYTNILSILELGGLAPRREERSADAPLIIGGGPCVYNPEPLADFFDCFFIGDAEVGILDVADAIRNMPDFKESPAKKEALLKELEKIPGIYRPESCNPLDFSGGNRDSFPLIKRRVETELDSIPYPEAPVLPLTDAVQERVTIEIARGCRHACRFCQAGVIYRPYRERSCAGILQLMKAGLQSTGRTGVSLSALSPCDHSEIDEITDKGIEIALSADADLGLASIRAGSLSADLIERIARMRRTGFTIAPECGSESLRSVLNKGITDENIYETAILAFSSGWQVLKLYFMIGLPGENEADLAAIAEMAGIVRDIGRRVCPYNSSRINISVSNFVPKPHSPFQRMAFGPMESLREKQAALTAYMRSVRIKPKYHDIEQSTIEAILARGDRKTGRLLMQAYKTGAKLDAWNEHFNFRTWLNALEKTGIDADRCLESRTPEELLPWEHIESGADPAWLLRQHEKALESIADRPFPVVLKPEMPPRCEKKRTAPKSRAGGVSGKTYRYRIAYARNGLARFLSQRETTKILLQILFRANIPIAHSAGFNPRPLISFADPLPVGVSSEREYFDVTCSEHICAPEQAERLNKLSLEGINFISWEELCAGTPKISKAIEGIMHRFALGTRLTEKRDLSTLVETFRASRTWPITVTRYRDGKRKAEKQEIRPLVEEIKFDLETNILEIIGFSGNRIINPYGFLSGFLGITDEESRTIPIVRRAICRKI